MNEYNKPKVGSIISWFGTRYTVEKVKPLKGEGSFVVTVKQNNGIELPLYWTMTKGCDIIKY